MPDFSDSRKGRRPNAIDSSLTRQSMQRSRPTMEDFKQPSRVKGRDAGTSGGSGSMPTVGSNSTTPNTPPQSPPSNIDVGKGGDSDIQRPEIVKDYLSKRGVDPLKPLPEKVERALRTEVARLSIIHVNPNLHPSLVCFQETIMPPSMFDVPFCTYFAETDSIHVPIEIGHRGAYDIPISADWQIPVPGDWRKWVKPPKAFWIEREKELELLWNTGKLVKRDVDRWGRPWGRVHAGLGKKPRSWGRREEVCIFHLNSGGTEKMIERFWREGKPGWVARFRFEKLVPLRDDRLPQWLEIELKSWLKVEHK